MKLSMKAIKGCLILFLVLVSCNQQRDHSTGNSPNEKEKKITDPPRFKTCHVFVNYLKNDNIEKAMSLIDMKYSTDKEINNTIAAIQKERLEKIRTILSEKKLSEEKDWIIVIDTIHYKATHNIQILRCISLTENILIPIDRGNNPIDSQTYVRVSFDLTELHPREDTILRVIIEHNDFLKQETNYAD